MKSIIVRSAIVLGLGIAPGAVLAQTQTQEILPKQQQQQTEGQSGATTETQGAGAATESQAGTTMKKPPEGQAGATEGQAQTEQPEGQTETEGTAQTEQPAGETKTEGTAQTEQPAGETKTEGTAQTEQPAGETKTEGTAQTEQPAGQTETEGTAQTEQPADSQDETQTGAVPPTEVTVEQKTEIKQVVQEVDVEPIAVDDIDFELNVGVAVPRTIEVHPLPPRIVEIVPQYEGYRYFILADGRIVIVEPDTLEIVVIIV